MYSILFQDRVVLLKLQPLSGVFAVLGGDIPAHTGLSGAFVFSTLQYNLNPVAFLCHVRSNFLLQYKIAVCSGFFQNCRDPVLVDSLDRFRRQLQGYPLVFLRNEETLLLKIGVKSALSLVIRVGNIVSYLRSLSSYLTNSCHNSALCVNPFKKRDCKYR